MEKTLPMSETLLQHDNRTLHLEKKVWGNSHVKETNITDSSPGWTKDENCKYWPGRTLDATASEAFCQFVRCKCKNKNGVYSSLSCRSCKRIMQKCTELCECRRQCK